MIGIIVALVCAALLLGFFFWMPAYLRRHPSRRPRSSSPTAGMVAAVDQVWHPEASVAQEIRDKQQHWVEPAPTPDDDTRVDGGLVRIDLP